LVGVKKWLTSDVDLLAFLITWWRWVIIVKVFLCVSQIF